MKGKIKEHPNNKRVLKTLRDSPVEVGTRFVSLLTLELQKEARNEAPRGVTSNLVRSIQPDKPKVAGGKITGSVTVNVDYGQSVHEGHIPQPQTGRTPASREALKRWLVLRGIPEKALWGVITELRRKGVTRPTPFLKTAFDTRTRAKDFLTLRRAVKDYQGKISTTTLS